MPISNTIRRMERGIRINADGLLTDEHGNSIAGVGAESLTKNAYYVDGADGLDSNSGEANSPWKTIGHASRYATTGSTIYVLPSTYLDPIGRADVVWYFTLGAVLSASPAVVAKDPITDEVITHINQLVVLGDGVFTGANFILCADTIAIDKLLIEAKAIYGAITLSYNLDDGEVLWRFRNIYFGSSELFGLIVNDSEDTVDPTPDIHFHNCWFHTTKVSCATEYVITACVSRIVQDLDENAVGDYVIYSNMKEQVP